MNIQDVFQEKIAESKEKDKQILKKIEEMIVSVISQADLQVFNYTSNEIRLLDNRRVSQENMIIILLNGEVVGELSNVTLPNRDFGGLNELFKNEKVSTRSEVYFINDEIGGLNSIRFIFPFSNKATS